MTLRLPVEKDLSVSTCPTLDVSAAEVNVFRVPLIFAFNLFAGVPSDTAPGPGSGFAFCSLSPVHLPPDEISASTDP